MVALLCGKTFAVLAVVVIFFAHAFSAPDVVDVLATLAADDPPAAVAIAWHRGVAMGAALV